MTRTAVFMLKEYAPIRKISGLTFTIGGASITLTGLAIAAIAGIDESILQVLRSECIHSSQELVFGIFLRNSR